MIDEAISMPKSNKSYLACSHIKIKVTKIYEVRLKYLKLFGTLFEIPKLYEYVKPQSPDVVLHMRLFFSRLSANFCYELLGGYEWQISYLLERFLKE